MSRQEQVQARINLQERAIECRKGLQKIAPRYIGLIDEAWTILFGEHPDSLTRRKAQNALNGGVMAGRDEPFVGRLEACLRYHIWLRERVKEGIPTSVFPTEA
jgi:hypothetical protein